jgi:hypothetical protein
MDNTTYCHYSPALEPTSIHDHGIKLNLALAVGFSAPTRSEEVGFFESPYCCLHRIEGGTPVVDDTEPCFCRMADYLQNGIVEPGLETGRATMNHNDWD